MAARIYKITTVVMHDPVGKNNGNSRNGTRAKTVLTDVEPVQVKMLRDTAGSLEPQIVKKRHRHLTSVDEMVYSLSGKGPHARGDIGSSPEVYGAEASKQTISTITDNEVMDSMAEWLRSATPSSATSRAARALTSALVLGPMTVTTWCAIAGLDCGSPLSVLSGKLVGMPYPTTYPAAAADQNAVDLAGRPCPRLTGPRELACRLAELDEHYIRSQFVALNDLAVSRDGGTQAARKLMAEGRLPQPAYRLDDGTDMVARDFFALLDAAGDAEALPEWFRSRYLSAAHRLGLADEPAEADEQWTQYLSGGYGVCLKQVTPESIAEKALHIATIEGLLTSPQPDDASWANRLRTAVDSLAAIERPGALLDPPRWGGPMSPQWYGAYLRAYFPLAFARPARVAG